MRPTWTLWCGEYNESGKFSCMSVHNELNIKIVRNSPLVAQNFCEAVLLKDIFGSQ